MLGVLKRRWKPKRASSSSNRRNSGHGGKPDMSTPLHQGNDQDDDATTKVIDKNRTADLSHPLCCDDKSQYLTLSPSPQPPPSPTLTMLPAYANPKVANLLCVEGGRIEFIKSPSEFANEQKTATSTLEHVRTVSRGQQTLLNREEEKSDVAKESLEARVLELEQALEREQSNGIRERLAIARLQRQLARREVHQRDVDRERRLRQDSEARLRDSAGEVDKHRTRLSSLQGELARMEETIRSLLQYKARNDTLKQEKTALTVAYESRIHQFQNTVTKLNQENAVLTQQVRHCEALSDDGHVQSALVERIRALEADNLHLTREADLQRRQYERCLDDVANKVVRALLSQKALREEITGLQRRIVELESQNRALTSVLVQQLQENHQGDVASAAAARRSSLEPLTPSGFSPDTPNTSISTPSTSDIAEEHALVKSRQRRHPMFDAHLWDESITSSKSAAADPVLWLPVPRPRSLNLHTGQAMAALPATPSLGKCKRRLSNGGKPLEDGDSPGNRDEGYSTMSSDVQDPLRSDAAPSTTRGLEDLKEETDLAVVTLSVTPVSSSKLISTEANGDPVYIPLSLALSLGGAYNRHSFPPSHNLLPFQHIMRSFSDSHLCLKFTTAPGPSSYSVSSATSSSPSILVLSGDHKQTQHPLRRTKGVNLLSTAVEGDEDDSYSNSGSWCSGGGGGDMVVEGCWWDADYVQHWLKLDDTRTTLQQQHRDMLEYDQTELEDWSMTLSSSEDIASEQWRGELSSAAAAAVMLPSIQEHNTAAQELEEDASECLWNNASYLMDRPGGELMTLLLEGEAGGMNLVDHCWPYGGAGQQQHQQQHFPCLAPASPGGSWSSSNSTDCCYSHGDCSYNCHDGHDGGGGESKRSSTALSDDAGAETRTDFTRDFYRLVKFESTKSLASTSSRSQAGDGGGGECGGGRGQDREQALQSVLHFIAEQQQYCASREEEDSSKVRCSSRPPSSYVDQEEDGEDDPCGGGGGRWTEYHLLRDDATAATAAATERDTGDAPRQEPPTTMLCDNQQVQSATHQQEGEEGEEAPSEMSYSEPNELEHTSNKSDDDDDTKLTEVLRNEHNMFTKHLQDKTFFPGLDVDHCIDVKGLLGVTSDYHPLGGAKRASASSPASLSPCEEDGGVSLTANIAPSILESRVAQVSSVPVLSKHDDVDVSLVDTAVNTAVNTAPLEANSFQNTFERCTVKLPPPPLLPPAEPPRLSFMSTTTCRDVLVTVIEEAEDEHPTSVSTTPDTVVMRTTTSTTGDQLSRSSSVFHDRATSKDVIEELNRMIREDGNDGEVAGGVVTRLDAAACCCPTGWVHVERDIDFTDPKARANLLDVMLASSDSSVGSSSSSSDSGDEPADYQRLHRLHRFRRQKKASASREPLGVLRCPAGLSRPSIIGRDDFFVRYGDKERDAVASFDFLEDISTTSVSGASSCDTSVARTRPLTPAAAATPPSSDDSDDRTGSGGQISLSDSCAASFSGSSTSLENQA